MLKPLRSLIFICCGFCLIWLDCLAENRSNTVSSGSLITSGEEFVIRSHAGDVSAIKSLVVIPHFNGYITYNIHINVVYLPDTGITWAGPTNCARSLVLLNDRVLGFSYDSGSGEMLRVMDSTNRFSISLKNTSQLTQIESEQFMAGRGRFSGDPSYVLRIEDIFGPGVMRDRRGQDIDGWPDTNAYSFTTRLSWLDRVVVEGTNAVVAIRVGTNILAKIAFDKEMHPKWATTNGVPIGPIPTNTVRHIEVMEGGKRRITVVH
jgi:hypothetical protein